MEEITWEEIKAEIDSIPKQTRGYKLTEKQIEIIGYMKKAGHSWKDIIKIVRKYTNPQISDKYICELWNKRKTDNL